MSSARTHGGIEYRISTLSLILVLLPRKSCGAFERLSRLKSFDYLALGELFALPYLFAVFLLDLKGKEKGGILQGLSVSAPCNI